MRVLHVIPSVSPAHGGPSHALIGMVRGVVREGLSVDVVTTPADRDGDLDVPLNGFVEQDGARYRFFPRQPPRSWTFSWPLTRWLYRHLGKYDVVHVHALFSYPTLAACHACRRRGVPYVLRPAGMLDPWCLANARWKKSPYYALLERRNLAGAAAVHATSQAEAANIARLGFGEKTWVIPLAVDLPDPAPRSEAPPAGAGLRVLYLGRLHPKKGVPVLFRAIAAVRRGGVEVSLIVAGDGDPAYRERLLKNVRELGIEDQVQFIGFVDGPQKAAAFRAADLFVLPSYQENFGVAALEAMSYGMPVVVSDQVALATEILQANAGRVVPVDDPLALAQAIVAYRDPASRRESSLRVQGLVGTRFTNEAQARSLVELYRTLPRGVGVCEP
jgi:glycosyltransferase involved in cell wall biosynthesis